MLLILKTDLETLNSANLRFAGRCDGEDIRVLDSTDRLVYEYWSYRFASGLINNMIDHLKDAELLAIVALAKRVISIGLSGRIMSGDQITRIVHTIERAHIARFDRKLKYARTSPQLLLEAKADLRDKETTAKQSD